MGLSHIPEDKLLPFETIKAATNADPEALKAVLQHFDAYITKLSVRLFYDESGRSYYSLDWDLKQSIEEKLTLRIIKAFRIE